MAPTTVKNNEFFTQLAKLVEQTQKKGHGSVFLTQKRLYYDADDKTAAAPSDDFMPAKPLPILVRASDGDTQNAKRVKNKEHIKFSTVVQPDDIESFFTRYADVCKAGMQSLRKRDRSKKKGKKKKATDAKS